MWVFSFAVLPLSYAATSDDLTRRFVSVTNAVARGNASSAVNAAAPAVRYGKSASSVVWRGTSARLHQGVPGMPQNKYVQVRPGVNASATLDNQGKPRIGRNIQVQTSIPHVRNTTTIE